MERTLSIVPASPSLFLPADVLDRPCGQLVVSPDTSWKDFQTQLLQLLQERFGPSADLDFNSNPPFVARYSLHLCEYNWQVFQHRLAHSKTNEILCVRCCVEERREVIRLEVNGLAGPLGFLEVRRDTQWNDVSWMLTQSFGRGRRLLGVAAGTRTISSEDEWREFLDRPPQVLVISCLWYPGHFLDYGGVEDYEEITQLEEALLHGDLKTAASRYMSGGLRYLSLLHSDQVLLTLFLKRFRQLLRSCSTPEEAATWYCKLSQIHSATTRRQAKTELASLAYETSGGRSLIHSPSQFQDSVPVTELWDLLQRDIVAYDDLPRFLKIKLNDREHLRDFLASHPQMVRYVPHQILIRHGLFLGEMVALRPWLYWQLPPEAQAENLEVLKWALTEREADQDSEADSDDLSESDSASSSSHSQKSAEESEEDTSASSEPPTKKRRNL